MLPMAVEEDMHTSYTTVLPVMTMWVAATTAAVVVAAALLLSVQTTMGRLAVAASRAQMVCNHWQHHLVDMLVNDRTKTAAAAVVATKMNLSDAGRPIVDPKNTKTAHSLATIVNAKETEILLGMDHTMTSLDNHSRIANCHRYYYDHCSRSSHSLMMNHDSICRVPVNVFDDTTSLHQSSSSNHRAMAMSPGNDSNHDTMMMMMTTTTTTTYRVAAVERVFCLASVIVASYTYHCCHYSSRFALPSRLNLLGVLTKTTTTRKGLMMKRKKLQSMMTMLLLLMMTMC
jgi:hypothetical protein